MNTNVRDRIISGLRRAMIVESDGGSFYTMVARTTSDEKGRQVFEALAREEAVHFDVLKRQHEALVSSGSLDASVALPSQSDLSSSRAIFSDELKKRIGDARLEMSALSIGIQLELNSIRHYDELAEAEADGDVKDFFRSLADWERGHYELLLAQYDDLKESYWQAAGFAPF